MLRGYNESIACRQTIVLYFYRVHVKIPGNIAGRCEKCLQFFYNVNIQDECVHHPGDIGKLIIICTLL